MTARESRPDWRIGAANSGKNSTHQASGTSSEYTPQGHAETASLPVADVGARTGGDPV